MKVGARLRILIQADSARFVSEVAAMLAATRYAESENRDLPSGYVQDCLIVEGTTDAWAHAEDLAVARNMLALVLGGPSLKSEQCQRTAWLPWPVAPEALEWFLDQLCSSAWQLTGRVENRGYDRYHCFASLGSDCELIDISEGGCQLEAPYEMAHHAPCPGVLDMTFPRLTDSVKIRVVQVRQAPIPGRCRLHGCFLTPSDRVREELQSWLAELAV